VPVTAGNFKIILRHERLFLSSFDNGFWRLVKFFWGFAGCPNIDTHVGDAYFEVKIDGPVKTAVLSFRGGRRVVFRFFYGSGGIRKTGIESEDNEQDDA
jgi:hypothetical protein